jgi:hypothetical protein
MNKILPNLQVPAGGTYTYIHIHRDSIPKTFFFVFRSASNVKISENLEIYFLHFHNTSLYILSIEIKIKYSDKKGARGSAVG